jgi:hypothetical protein
VRRSFQVQQDDACNNERDAVKNRSSKLYSIKNRFDEIRLMKYNYNILDAVREESVGAA